MAKPIKKRQKMTTDDRIRLFMSTNFWRIFSRKWGAPTCELCESHAYRLRDAIVEHYISMTIEERDTLGTRHFVADQETFAIIHSGVWLVDAVRMLECETLPACPSCGYKPANRFAESEETDQP